MASSTYQVIFEGSAENFERVLQRLESSTESTLGSITSSFGVAGGIIGSYLSFEGIKVGAEKLQSFDDRLQKVAAVSSATGEQFELIEEKALSLGKTTRYTAEESAEGMQMLAMAGMKVNDIMTAIPNVLAAAAAEGVDLGVAADISTNILAGFGGEVGELTGYLDKLITTSTNSNSTLIELGEASKYVSPIASALGGNISDVSAALGLLHNSGIKGTMAGTTLRGVLDSLFNSTADEAAMLQELSLRIGGAGLQLKDVEGNFVGFASLVDQLNAAGIEAGEALRLFGQRGGPGMAVLLAQGSKAMVDLRDKIESSDGKAASLAEQMESGIGGASRRAAAAMEGALLRVMREGEPLLLAFYKSAENIGDVLDVVIGNAYLASGALNGVYAVAQLLASPFLAAGAAMSDGMGGAAEMFDSIAESANKSFSAASKDFSNAALNFSGMAGEVETSTNALSVATTKTSEKFKEVSAATGETIESMEDLDDAVAAGLIEWEEASGAWVSTDAEKRLALEANAEAIKNASKSAAAAAAAGADGVAAATLKMANTGDFEAAAAKTAALFKMQVDNGESAVAAAATAYEAIAKLHSDAAGRGLSQTAAMLREEAAQYEAGSESTLSFKAKMLDDALKLEKSHSEALGGIITEGLVAATEAAARARLDVIEASSGEIIDKERIVQQEVLNLQAASAKKSVEILRGQYEQTGSLSEEYLDAVRGAAEVEVEIKRNSGQQIIDAEEYIQSQVDGVINDHSKARASAMQQVYELGGVGRDEYIEAERAAAESQVEEWVKSGIDRVAAETAAAQKIENLILSMSETATDAVESVPEEKEVKITADASSVVDAADDAKSALSRLSGAVESVQMSTYQYLQEISSSSMLLNPGEVSRQMQAIEQESVASADRIKSDRLQAGEETMDGLLQIEAEARQELIQANLTGSKQAIEDAKSAYEDAIDARLDKAKEAAEEEWEDYKKQQEEAFDAQKKAAEGAAEARKEALEGQLDAAEEALDLAEKMEKAYWDNQLSVIEDYYKQVEDERDAALDAAKEAAQEEYDYQVDLIQKKIDLMEKEKDIADERLSTLRDLYQNSGEAGNEYYKAEMDAAAARAQAKKDSGVDEVLVEKWLQAELDKLRTKGAEEGINGLDNYSESIINSYQRTGEFSIAVDMANDSINALKEQLNQLKEAGADAFLDEIKATATFDSQLVSIQGRIDEVQGRIDGLNGENFDLTGQTAESLAASVADAEGQVTSLKSAIDAIDAELEGIKEMKFKISVEKEEYVSNATRQNQTSSSYSSGGYPSSLDNFFGMLNFEGGGYTGSGPRIGGVDGRGGKLAVVHPDETVIDHKAGNGSSGNTYMTINTVEVKITDSRQTPQQIRDQLSRIARRGGYAN